MVTDVNAMNLIAFRIADIAIQGTPTEAKGTNKDIIEKIDIYGNNRDAAYPPRPSRQAL